MSSIRRLILLHLLCFWIEVQTTCPDIPNCVCPENKNSNNKHLKLRCSHLQSIEELLSNEQYTRLIPTSINALDLSNNSIRVLPADAFPVPITSRLNLDKNNLETIEDNAFRGLHNLKKLVLSNNKLRELRKHMFVGLDSVDQLKISHNSLTVIRNDTFDFLPALKQLDISNNPLDCTCDTLWLMTSRFKLNPVPKCDSPRELRGQPMDTTPLHTECNTAYSFNISPVDDQIVFEGDSLKMKCIIRGLGHTPTTDQLISWNLEGYIPTHSFENTTQSQDVNVDSDTIESALVISELNEGHTGEWSCHISSAKFNRSLSVRVNVLSKYTIYCDSIVTENDKGRYTWPASTVAGHLVDLPCAIADASSTSIGTVTHFCSNNGSWINLNTNDCPYTSPVTRILQDFSRMNLTNHKSSLIQSATGFQNYTASNIHNITHVKDFHFIVTTMENYIKFLEAEPDLTRYLLELVNSVLKLPKSLMEKAQQQHFACSRMIATIEGILKYSPKLDFSSKEFAVTEVLISSNNLSGITCSWIRYIEDLTLNCSTQNKTLVIGSVLEASMHVSVNSFYQSATKSRLVVTVFNDSRLFPDNSSNEEASLVIGVTVVGSNVLTPNEPITITVKKSESLLVPTLAWWNSEKGVWTKNACRLNSSIFAPHLKFSCDRFGYFSLLSEHYEEVVSPDRNVHQKLLFNFAHPSIYVGTFVCVTCLYLASATYCFCYVHIQMSKKMKHSLMNSWISASLLFLVFSIGIHQTDHEILCQTIGLSVHYFMLATLFWMAATIKALHKRVQKSCRSVSTPSEDLPADVPIEKPILGVYLVGWGISAIICGIAGAVNMRGYSGPRYCFLSPGPELCTVLIPAGVVMFYLLIMCLMVRCAVAGVESNPQLSVGTQAIDLDLLDSNCGANGLAGGRSSYTHEVCNSVRSITTPSSQAEDTEHSPARQLKAFIIFWIFYLLAVISAAASIMKPSHREEKLYSLMYAVVCLLMGAFVLFFHCFARNDVRSAWSRLLRGKGDRQKSPHIIANSFMPTAPTTHTLASMRTTETGPDPPAGTPNTFQPPIVIDNRSIRSDFLKQTPNINLVRLHRQAYRGCSTLMADGNFYNPHQSIVAKKFFKKQRKKRNHSLQVRKCRSGGSSPVSSAFLFNGDVARMKMNAVLKRHDEGDGCDNEENVEFLRRERYDELSSEKHPLTYDDPDITGCEEGKTGTESEATFTVPEYAEIHEQNSAAMNVPPRIPTKEQMCGTSDHDWCSCDAISDVNSEPTYNYAYIRNGYASSRSVMSDNSSGNSHLYTSVVADVSNSVDRFRHRARPRAQPPRSRALKTRPSRTDYRGQLAGRTHHQPNYGSEFAKNCVENGDFRKRRKEEGYKMLTKEVYRGLSPSSDFSSEDKVETCV